MSLVFLFGAGASFGSGDCYPEPPPLGNDLFQELQKVGEVAASIGKPLSDLFKENFEAGMAEFFSKRNAETTAFLREMSLYFARFKPGPNNLYLHLIEILRGKNRSPVFVTTNYDLLIELAINQAGYYISYKGFPIRKNNIPLLKIHGSCNFLPAHAPQQIRGIGFIRTDGGPILESGIRVASPQEVVEFCDREDSTAPAVAMYAKGKQVLFCPSFVLRQQEAWHQEVRRASSIFVIGLNVNQADAHIWDSLRLTKAPLFYVGAKEPFLEWKSKVYRKQAYVIATTFEDSLPIIKKRVFNYY